MKNNKGVEKLALIMEKRSKQINAKFQQLPVELGKIDAELNLIVDSLPEYKIPKDLYLVNRLFCFDDLEPMTITLKSLEEGSTFEGKHNHSGVTEIGGTPGHTHTFTLSNQGEHQHSVHLPIALLPLKVNDRVLVIWTLSIPVIVCVVKKI
jgi:hypothetical protein